MDVPYEHTRFRFTHHAVDRFIKRIKPGASHTEAMHTLAEGAQAATRLREKTAAGDMLYKVDGPPEMRWIVKPDDGYLFVVTVLPPEDKLEDALAIYEEEQAERDRGAAILREHGLDAGEDQATTPAPADRMHGWHEREATRMANERRRLAALRAAIDKLASRTENVVRLDTQTKAALEFLKSLHPTAFNVVVRSGCGGSLGALEKVVELHQVALERERLRTEANAAQAACRILIRAALAQPAMYQALSEVRKVAPFALRAKFWRPAEELAKLPPEIDGLTCQVCGDEPAIIVASSSLGPVSYAYGATCAAVGVEPYGAAIAAAACAGGEKQHVSEGYVEVIEMSAAWAGKTAEEFWAEAKRAADEMDAELERMAADEQIAFEDGIETEPVHP